MLDSARDDGGGAAPPAPSEDALLSRLDDLARCPVLLVATDFDGTLAPIVNDPARAEANRESLVALKALSGMPQTHIAVISGRALRDLASRTAGVDEAHLVGSHGSEFEADSVAPLSAAQQDLLTRLAVALRELAGGGDGFQIEVKPASLAFHYRNAEPSAAEGAVAAIERGLGRWPGVYLRQGKMVVELSVVRTHKGEALQRLRQRLGASGVLFLGDDSTDEDAFATLQGPDVGVKVGPGSSAARHRAADTQAVARVLARVTERRAEWIAGAAATPIEQHSVLSDQRTVALLDPRGRLVWMCAPRIDSAALFAELLGGPLAGFFEIRPVDGRGRARQAYLRDSLVLVTDWGGVRICDYLDCGGGRAFQRAGRTDLLRVVEGCGDVGVIFAPRLDFGRIETRLSVAEDGIVIEGAVDPVVLRAPGVRWSIVDEGRHQTATATVHVDSQPLVLELRYGTANLAADRLTEAVRRERVRQFWAGWAATLTLPSAYREACARSALVIKGLCYGPTGAIAAAATTSLPEHAGGVRNWDYRFCWPRDAAMAAEALARLGATGPALKLLDWILGILDECEPGALLSPVYSVTGGHLGPEGEIGELAGYRGSRPVRVGNAAARQVQLDVFGPIASLVALLAERGAALSSEHWRMLDHMVTTVAARWREADHGIWEARRARRNHVHSKVMCWQTVDRALQVARYLGRRRPDWEELRAAIAEDVVAGGWRAGRGAFAATYEEDDVDAAVLWVGLSGMLPPTDPRVIGTIADVERQLREGPAVYRYRYDDGLSGLEGAFNLCTTWLIEALSMAGRREEAESLLGDYLDQQGPTGLMSEEYDPKRGQALGNFPQAYSHLGLINAATRVAT
ncbi:Trehalase [Phycisphaerae bacterium RAS1]|nr:Trehalase [Phycisphaerae bacterium RAS1]